VTNYLFLLSFALRAICVYALFPRMIRAGEEEWE
jgi:hypothetical protein